MTDVRLKDLKSGYAIVLYRQYNRYFGNTFVYRIVDDVEEAKYNASSLSRCDNTNYSVYDCKAQRLIY